MSATPKNPAVGALICFTSAVYVIAAPVLALARSSFTPVWLGLLLLLGSWLLVVSADQFMVYRSEQKMRALTKFPPEESR